MHKLYEKCRNTNAFYMLVKKCKPNGIMPFYAKENLTVSCLAVTKDFRNYKRFGRITEACVDDRDVVLFPAVINGKYVLITRPKFKNVPNVKMPSIWLSFRDDLL